MRVDFLNLFPGDGLELLFNHPEEALSDVFLAFGVELLKLFSELLTRDFGRVLFRVELVLGYALELLFVGVCELYEVFFEFGDFCFS